VLISIQSLILVPDPYWNEPGFQSRMHTDAGKAEAFRYADERRVATIEYAMIKHLESPPEGFGDVVRNHFKMRKAYLLKQCAQWEAASREKSSSFASQLATKTRTLTALLDRM
jgi:baculoviral IAP repeat-containing protein 6 (apollon)